MIKSLILTTISQIINQELFLNVANINEITMRKLAQNLQLNSHNQPNNAST